MHKYVAIIIAEMLKMTYARWHHSLLCLNWGFGLRAKHELPETFRISFTIVNTKHIGTSFTLRLPPT